MLISYEYFSLITIFSILIPITGVIVLLIVLTFEKQLDTLAYEKRQVELENTLQESTYMQLNQQIHPHFLFNTINLMLGLARLNRIDTLIQALEALSLFLRFKYQVKDSLIPLKKEWEYTQYYLKIQALRFQNRLTIHEEMAEDTLEVMVPPYILQTLTENAFKHGLEKKVGPLNLTIKSYSEGDHIVLHVEDNGLGFGSLTYDDMVGKGHGLENIDKRLKLLYETASLQLLKNSDGGMTVLVTIPKERNQLKEE